MKGRVSIPIWAWIFFAALPQVTQASCSLYGTPLAFGTYLSPIQTSDVLSSNVVTVTCDTSSVGVAYKLNLTSTQTESYKKYLSGGNSKSQDKLYYNTYLDSGRSTIWGGGLSGTSSYSGTTTANTYITVYSKIDKNQSVSPGTYTDTVTVQMEF